MRVFLDFEASSLAKDSYPIEVGWVFEDGRAETHLIRPAPGWTDWDGTAEAVHGIGRDTLEADGEPVAMVAARMIEVLVGQDVYASAPSWDGKWLSVLLRAAGLPRHALRLAKTDEVQAETAAEILGPHLPERDLAERVEQVLARARLAHTPRNPAHRALADAREERELWLTVRRMAGEEADAIARRASARTR
jgi:hypothetical protein